MSIVLGKLVHGCLRWPSSSFILHVLFVLVTGVSGMLTTCFHLKSSILLCSQLRFGNGWERKIANVSEFIVHHVLSLTLRQELHMMVSKLHLLL